MARCWGPPRILAGGPGGLTCTVVALAALVAGCSGDEPEAAPATTTTTPPASAVTSAAGTVSPTTTAPAFDCGAVDTARTALDDAYARELDRLDVDRGDPRAQSVYALVTTAQGPAYYTAVLAAAPADLRADAQVVLDYYERLSQQVGVLDVADGSERALADAVDRLDDATLALDPSPAATAGASDVVVAQERLEAGVERSCSGPDAASPTSSAPTSPATTPPEGGTATTS
ncbi:hypothetical protein GTR02_06285 [Kineococcus sp. R8]|uniref:hypothetical protein n=1 Tax=Kineococcus siccus TaxID=2696567 RepID=UPI001412DD64|nr:hypothetical protein [Kineococcus siccus]NAZ81421.1 hypothetical protein [Kineococcus siccus]